MDSRAMQNDINTNDKIDVRPIDQEPSQNNPSNPVNDNFVSEVNNEYAMESENSNLVKDNSFQEAGQEDIRLEPEHFSGQSDNENTIEDRDDSIDHKSDINDNKSEIINNNFETIDIKREGDNISEAESGTNTQVNNNSSNTDTNTNTDTNSNNPNNKTGPKVHHKRPIKVINEKKGENDMYECKWDECHDSFKSFDDLINHLNVDHIDTIDKSTEYGCLWRDCNRKDKPNGSRAALRNHVRVHTGEKPYTCKICHKKFTRSDALNKHSKKCTEEIKPTKRKRDEDTDTPHTSKKRANSMTNKYFDTDLSSLKYTLKHKHHAEKILRKELKHLFHGRLNHDKAKSLMHIPPASNANKSFKEQYHELKAKYRHSLQENMILEEEYQHDYRQLSRLKVERNIILDNLIEHLTL